MQITQLFCEMSSTSRKTKRLSYCILEKSQMEVMYSEYNICCSSFNGCQRSITEECKVGRWLNASIYKTKLRQEILLWSRTVLKKEFFLVVVVFLFFRTSVSLKKINLTRWIHITLKLLSWFYKEDGVYLLIRNFKSRLLDQWSREDQIFVSSAVLFSPQVLPL